MWHEKKGVIVSDFPICSPLLTMIPNSSRRKLMLVFCLSSPPSVISTRTHPPWSMYSRSTWNYRNINITMVFRNFNNFHTSPAVNLSLGPPNIISLAPFNFSAVMSSLCRPIVQWCLRRDWRVLKPELGTNSSFLEALKRTVLLEVDKGWSPCCAVPFIWRGFMIALTCVPLHRRS